MYGSTLCRVWTGGGKSFYVYCIYIVLLTCTTVWVYRTDQLSFSSWPVFLFFWKFNISVRNTARALIFIPQIYLVKSLIVLTPALLPWPHFEGHRATRGVPKFLELLCHFVSIASRNLKLTRSVSVPISVGSLCVRLLSSGLNTHKIMFIQIKGVWGRRDTCERWLRCQLNLFSDIC